MQFNKITDADRDGKGNVGQPDTPNLTTQQMQELLDALPNLSIDKFNEFIDVINAAFQTSITHASTDDQIPTAKAVWEFLNGIVVNSGVGSFNDRSGLVVPQSGDYSAEMITYDSSTVKAVIASLSEALAQEVTDRQNAITSAVSSEASTRDAADTALGTRIDNIVAPSGEAPSAAEVTDARVGDDGIPYNSLGLAIRKQLSFIKGAIGQLNNVFELNDNSYTIAAGGSKTQALFTKYLPIGTYVISCDQSATITSADRNQFFYDLGGTKTYESTPHLTIGAHTWMFTITTAGTYTFSIWVANPSGQIVLSNFVLCEYSIVKIAQLEGSAASDGICVFRYNVFPTITYGTSQSIVVTFPSSDYAPCISYTSKDNKQILKLASVPSGPITVNAGYTLIFDIDNDTFTSIPTNTSLGDKSYIRCFSNVNGKIVGAWEHFRSNTEIFRASNYFDSIIAFNHDASPKFAKTGNDYIVTLPNTQVVKSYVSSTERVQIWQYANAPSSLSISVPNVSALLYNITSNQFEVITGGDVALPFYESRYVLCFINFAGVIYGQWARYLTESMENLTYQYTGVNDEKIQYVLSNAIPSVDTSQQDVVIVQPGTLFIKDNADNVFRIDPSDGGNVTLNENFTLAGGRYYINVPHNKVLVLNTLTRTMELLTNDNRIPVTSIILAAVHRGKLNNGIYKELLAVNDHVLLQEQNTETGFGTPTFDLTDCSEELQFVNNELWMIASNADDHSQYGRIWRYGVDFETKQFTVLGKFKQNWGHCNTVDYNAGNDCLILGNGGGNDAMDYNEFYVIPNVAQFRNYTENQQAPLADVAITYRLSAWNDEKYGKQINAVWGDSNYNRNDLAYIISNNGKLMFVRLIQLGKGINEFEYGTLIQGASADEFNGTWREINYWCMPYSDSVVIQGGCYYNGDLFFGVGHDGQWAQKLKLGFNHNIIVERRHTRHYTADGSAEPCWTAGLTIKDGYIFMGYLSGDISKTFGYKLPSGW